MVRRSLKRTAQRSPSVSKSPRSPSSWSPRTKEAARTIKRIVMKIDARSKYQNFVGNGGISRVYQQIRAGNLPTHVTAITRRMHMFPVKVNVPLYRGIRSGPTMNKLLSQGYLVNKSITSFSTNRWMAESFSTNNNKKGYILVLPPGKYPAINRQKFAWNISEFEITLAPGVYTINKNRPRTNNGNIRVTYKPLRNNNVRQR